MRGHKPGGVGTVAGLCTVVRMIGGTAVIEAYHVPIGLLIRATMIVSSLRLLGPWTGSISGRSHR